MSSEQRTDLWNRGWKDGVTIGIVDPFISGDEFGPYYEGFQAGKRLSERAA